MCETHKICAPTNAYRGVTHTDLVNPHIRIMLELTLKIYVITHKNDSLVDHIALCAPASNT